MDKFLKMVGAAVLIGVLLCVVPMAGFLGGGFSGLVVGWWFPETVGALTDWLNIDARPWQVGALLGFVGGYFRSTSKGSAE